MTPATSAARSKAPTIARAQGTTELLAFVATESVRGVSADTGAPGAFDESASPP